MPRRVALPNMPIVVPRPRLRWSALVAVGLLLALLLHGVARSQPAVVLADAQGVAVTQGVELLVEEAGTALTREQVMDPAFASRWQSHAQQRINLPRETRPIWVRFDLKNRTPRDDWLLGVDWPMLRSVALHQYDPQAQRWLASRHAELGRGVDGNVSRGPSFAFALEAPVGRPVTLLLRVVPISSPMVPITIRDAASWGAERYDRGVLAGVLFGILGVMLLYNASLLLFTGDRSYAWYTAYLVTVIAYELVTTGYGPLYVWGTNDWMNTYGYGVSASLCFLFASLFFRQFLDLKHCGLPHLLHMNSAFIAFWIMALAWSLRPSAHFYGAAALVGALSGFVAIYSSVRLMWRGNVSARYFTLAWSALVVGTFAMLLSVMGITQGNLLADYGQHIGFAVETVLLSVALADRIRRERHAREQARQETLRLTRHLQAEREQKIVAQADALAAQREANEALEQRVQARTAELERANEELGQLSITDALTQLHNRRYFDEVLAREMESSARTGEPLALLLVDIDHFKQINDRCGHLAGDEGLKLVAQALRATAARTSDLVARYGGEEFALVLPGTDAAQALDLAERARRAVESVAYVNRGERIALRVSVGVIARVAAPDDKAADFIAQADAALYRAKSAGRNRVELSGAQPVSSATQ